MARKSLLKRAVSSFTALAIATVTMPVIPAFAETGSITYSFDGYDVEYLVKNEWTEGQSVEVKITNTGDEPILNWAFKYDAEGVIDGLWNASVYDTKETSYIIKNVGWNYEIAPDASVSFGYTLSDYNGTNPDKFELCAKRVDKTDGYDVQYNITNEWDTGLQGEIVITNTSEEPLEAWELSFDSTFEINNLWDGRIISAEENHYVVASEMWSNPIDVGGSKTIGFTGTKQAANDVALSNFSLSVVIIDDDGNSGGTGGNTGNDDPNPNPDIDITTDTDSDQIPDAYEEIFGTDKNKPDTDDDGLTDYEEIALTGTDPLVYDSVTEGISDADADCDEDGLTNKEELTLGTSPTSADTDFDGLSDYDEINVYNTDPLNPDTDGDGINDGDEIKLGTDPNSDTTDGVKDTERVTHQVIGSDSDVFSYLNDDDNPLKISVEIDAAGLAENCLTVDKSKYYHAIENSAVVGVIPEFEYADGLKVDNMTIKFEVDETARANKIGSYAKECAELEGIKRLNVFEYFDDIGVLLPIETHHDVENNIVYAETAEMGTYCVLDMEIWFKNLGIDPISTDENIEVSHIDLAYNSAASLSDGIALNSADTTTREKVDLALCLDTRTCVSSTEFSKMKQAIKYIVDLSYDNKLNVGDIYVYYQDKSGYHKKLITKANLSDLDGITRSIDVYYKKNNTKIYYFDLTAMLEYTYNNISNRDNVIFLITNREDIVVQNALVNKLKSVAKANAERVHVVMMGDNMYAGAGAYFDMFIGATNGLLRSSLDEYTVGDVLQTYLEPTSYKILLANKFEEVELKGMLRKASDIDSDDDGKSDWDEIDFDVVDLFKPNPLRNYSFNSQFPINQNYANHESSHQPMVLTALDRTEPYKEIVMMKAAAPVISSPSSSDSDGDGYADGPIDVFKNGKINDLRPLHNDVDITKIKNSDEWVKIENKPKDVGYICEDYCYGSWQSWMNNSALTKAPIFEFEGGGCGIVASADILTYLSLRDKENYVKNISGIDVFNSGIYDKKSIGKSKYTEYLLYMGKNKFKPWTGIPDWLSEGTKTWGIQPQDYLKFFNDLEMGYSAVMMPASLKFSYKHLIPGLIINAIYHDQLMKQLKVSLNNDVPVTALYCSNGVKLYEYDKYLLNEIEKTKWFHYVNVTEFIEDHIAGKTILTISSWGEKYQVLWDDFINQYNEILWGNWLVIYER